MYKGVGESWVYWISNVYPRGGTPLFQTPHPFRQEWVPPVEKREGTWSQAQRGGFFPQGKSLLVERAEDHRQDPEAHDQGGERPQAGHAGQAQERDVY